MTKETRGYVARQVETGKEINWHDAIKPSTITNGLRYSLATGNWGVQVCPPAVITLARSLVVTVKQGVHTKLQGQLVVNTELVGIYRHPAVTLSALQ